MDTLTQRTLPKRTRHTVPVRWRYGAEQEDEGEVMVEGYDAPRFVEDMQRLLELRDAVLGLAQHSPYIAPELLRPRLAELHERAKKLLFIDLPEPR